MLLSVQHNPNDLGSMVTGKGDSKQQMGNANRDLKMHEQGNVSLRVLQKGALGMLAKESSDGELAKGVLSSQCETIANLATGKELRMVYCVQRRVELLYSKVPIALNYVVRSKDLLSILEESTMVGIQGGERIKEVSSMQVNNI